MPTFDNGSTEFSYGMSTRQAAAKMGVCFRTLNRWIELGRLEASQGVPLPNGKCLWLWSAADVARGRKIKSQLKPGRKPKSASSAEPKKGDSRK
jgi:hypothetical protein